jgi:protein gp37
MNKTKIEWVKNPNGTQGYSWNPITGCLNGCEYCYARKLANGRLKSKYLANKNIIPPYKDIEGFTHTPTEFVDLMPFYPRSWFDRRERLLEGVKPKGVFVCDMSDLFGIGIPESWTECVLETIKVCPEHRFYLLTKQPQNLKKWSPFPKNCWVGVSVTDAEGNNPLGRSIYTGFDKIEATVKFISFEPLLADVRLDYRDLEWAGVGWVIIGQQTPVKTSTMPKIEWVRDLVESADRAGVPVFLKDNMMPLLKDCIGIHAPYWRITDPDNIWPYARQVQLRQEIPIVEC